MGKNKQGAEITTEGAWGCPAPMDRRDTALERLEAERKQPWGEAQADGIAQAEACGSRKSSG